MLAFRLALIVALACGVGSAAPDDPKGPTPKFKPGRDTTFVEGPLDADGCIDYEAALNERLKGKITPETNAVVLLMKCFGPKPAGKELHADFYIALGIEAPPAKGNYLVSAAKHFAADTRGEGAAQFQELETRLRRTPWKAADSPGHAAWLKANEEPLAVAVEASRRRDHYAPLIGRKVDGSRGMLIGAQMPTVQKCRDLASLLSLRATLKLGEGKIDDAFADALAIHRLGRLVSRGSFAIDLLVGIALQAIAHSSELVIFEHGRPTAKQALAYRDELRKLPPMATVADKLGYERFSYLDAVNTSFKEGFDILSLEKLEKGQAEALAKKLDRDVIFRLGNFWFDKMVVAMKKPKRAERVADAVALEKELDAMTADSKDMAGIIDLIERAEIEKVGAKVSEKIGRIYVRTLMPAFRKIGDAADRGEQIHRNGVLAAALAAHFADGKKYPEKLADLVPKYLDKVPDDLFAGKPLVYKKTDAGYLFYSVGINGTDDGGKLQTDGAAGDDLGVRMPRK